MRRAPRPTALLVVAGLALTAAGCGSNNKGKIEGTWKVTELPASSAGKSKDEFAQMSKMGMYMQMEFKPDGMLTIGLGADKPETLDLVKLLTQGKPTSGDAKYKLLSGDGVELYDMPKEMQEKGGEGMFKGKDRAKVTVKIDGDSMTMTGDDGQTVKLLRVK
jgi:hypothetical protein